MSRKLVLAPIVLESSKSLAASFFSPATVLDFQDNVLYQIDVTTSDSEGEFAVQVSQDYQPPNGQVTANAGTWVDLPISGTPSVNAANDNILISLNQVPFHAMRLKYTQSVAGTGTCKITLTARPVGS